MSRELFALLCALFVVFVALLTWWGISARRRKQGDIAEPDAWTSSSPTLVVDAMYVATSRAGDPYDRVFAHGLGFRGRTQLAIDSEGVELLADRREMRINRSRVRGVARATWTIDRVVETGGIIVISHELGADVDTYVRVIGDDAAAFEALQRLAPNTTPSTPAEGTTA